MEPTTDHIKRIQDELKAVGTSAYGKIKFATKYLPKIIHPDEHIRGAIYGRYKEGSGILGYSAGMLVATDHRILFLDHKPGFTSMDELTYEAVVGVKHVSSGISSTVTVHTRMGDYVIRYANSSGVHDFIEYVEKRRLDTSEKATERVDEDEHIVERPEFKEPSGITPEAIEFLLQHDLGVLSTMSRTGSIHGSAVYYHMDTENRLYIVTKAGTQKARDMFAQQQIAFTVFDANTAQTAQIQADSEVISDPAERQYLLERFLQPKEYGGKKLPMPITTIHEDGYVVIRLNPTDVKYSDYKAKLEKEA